MTHSTHKPAGESLWDAQPLGPLGHVAAIGGAVGQVVRNALHLARGMPCIVVDGLDVAGERLVVDMKPGTIEYLPPGRSVRFLSPPCCEYCSCVFKPNRAGNCAHCGGPLTDLEDGSAHAPPR